MAGYPYRTTLTYSYTGFQQSQGDNSFPGTNLDTDLKNVKRSLDEIIDFLTVSVGSDGRLAPQSVGINALAFEIRERLAGEVIAEVNAIASNILLTPVSGLAAGDLQTAIALLMANKAAADHIHSASATPITAIADLAGTNVQAALAELRAFAPRTGDAHLTLDDVAPFGWLMMADGTIGSASSGASDRAHVDCEALYKLIWNKVDNDYAPVTGGRGVSANADWSANKPIALTKQLGRTLAVAGAGAGLTVRPLGAVAGAEAHVLTHAQLPNVNLTAQSAGSHNHSYQFPGNTTAEVAAVAPRGVKASGDGAPQNTSDAGLHTHNVPLGGSNEPHSNMQPTSFWNIRIKL